MSDALPASPAARLLLWRELCAWLEDQPYNAAYPTEYAGQDANLRLPIVGPGGSVIRTEEVRLRRCELARHGGRWTPLIEGGAAGREERRRVGLIFWSSGRGWRLRKHYRARLAELAGEVPEEELILAALQRTGPAVG